MATAKSVLERDYFLEFPAVVRKKMNINRSDRFFVTMAGKTTLLLSRCQPEQGTPVNLFVVFHVAHGTVLPACLLDKMRVRPGSELELKVKDRDKIIIQKSTVIPLFPSGNQRDMLEQKLNKELERPSNLFNQSFLEDIHSVLTLNEWSDDVMLALIKTPNLLQALARILHNDDMLSALFEQRAKDLILELADGI